MKRRIIRIAQFQAVLLTVILLIAGCVQIPAEIEKNPASDGKHDRSARASMRRYHAKSLSEKKL